MSYAVQKATGTEQNKLYEKDTAIHDWYRFVLSFPPHLVRQYIKEFSLTGDSLVFDPFCGTGTTLVEAKKLGVKSLGFEANPVMHMCASTKVDWNVEIDSLLEELDQITALTFTKIKNHKGKLYGFSEDKQKLLIKNSISPLPLHKALILLETIDDFKSSFENLYKTAFAKQVVLNCSNLKFNPEVSVSRIKKTDADVVGLWKEQVLEMVGDIKYYQKFKDVYSKVILGDSRQELSQIKDDSIDAVITSPPYPNEKDYTRATRLESVLLGFINTSEDLRAIKKTLLRSNSKGIYKDDDDLKWIKENQTVNQLAEEIERTRMALHKTSGFEKLYYKVVLQYFGGLAKHLNSLKPKLKNGAKLAYIVGDQCSFFRIPIRTGHILAEIANALGYKVLRIDLFRTRLATATKEKINEEVVILEYQK